MLVSDPSLALPLAALSAAAASLLAALRGLGGPGAGPALLLAMAAPFLIYGGDATLAAPGGLLVELPLAFLCWRAGVAGRRALARVPLLPCLGAACLLVLLGSFLTAGLARWLAAWGAAGAASAAASPFGWLLLGALALLPGGSSAAARPAGTRGRLDGMDALQALLLIAGLPLVFAMNALESSAAVGMGETLQRAVFDAAAGLIAGGLAGLLCRHFGPGGAVPAVRLALAGLLWGLAELQARGLGALALVSAGLAAGPAGRAEESAGGAPSPPALGLAPAALLLAGAGLRFSPADLQYFAAGAGLWAGLAVVRLLILVGAGGVYRWLYPGRLSWTWIADAACFTSPGAISTAYLATGAAVPFALLLPVIALSLLVEGGIAARLERRPLEPDDVHRLELARGRRIALRAGSRALETLAQRGDLDALPQVEREALSATLERREKLVDLEVEELFHQSPWLKRHGRSAAAREVALAAMAALEEACRSGLLSRAALEELRDEVWMYGSSGIPAEPAESPKTEARLEDLRDAAAG
jgi:hypothetical protein